MLPAPYQLPAAIVLLLGGTVACFFGYRMFRLVLAIFGFIFGVFAASSLVAPSDTTSMLVVAAVGGLAGAGILFAAYFVGVALFGAGIGAVVANLSFSASGRDPHFLVIAFCAVAGAVASMYLQRYVDHPRHRLRRSVDDDRGRDGARRRSRGQGRSRGQRRMGALSAQSGARPAVVANRLDRACLDWHRGATGLDGRGKRPSRTEEAENQVRSKDRFDGATCNQPRMAISGRVNGAAGWNSGRTHYEICGRQ